MAQNTIVELIRFFKECLAANGLHVSGIVLFGSQAKGTATVESDIDLAIVSEDFIGKTIFERASLIAAAKIQTIKKFVLPLDVLLLSPDELETGDGLLIPYVRAGQVF